MQTSFIAFFIFISLNQSSFCQSEKDFQKIWSFNYLSDVSNSIKEYAFFKHYRASNDTVYSDYYFSSDDNEKNVSIIFLQHLFQPKCLSEFFGKFKETSCVVFKLIKSTHEYDKFGNLTRTNNRVMKTYSIEKSLVEKLNWEYIKDTFFISSKGTAISSLFFRIALEINTTKIKEFNKFVKNLNIVH